MAQITVKRSAVEGKIPLVADLQLGELAINTYDGKLFLKRNNGISDYIVEVGGNQGFEVKNQTGSTLTKGTLVQFAGTVGSSGKLLAAPFLADGTNPSEYFIGVVLDTIPNGGDGFVVDHGKIYDINTSAYAAGTILYASATVAGAFTSTRPEAPNNKITVAAVVNSHANAGVLEVRVTPGSQLNNDELVELGTLVGGDALTYNATTERFENTALKTVNGTSLLGSGNIVIEAPANAAPNRQVYTATANQTTFSITYDPGYLDAFVNGVKQVSDVDYAATNGTTVVFSTGLEAGDIVDLVGYTIVTVSNSDPSKLSLTGGTMTGAITFAAGQTFSGTQQTLVSGTNIKTINGTSILGSGDLALGGAYSAQYVLTGTTTNNVETEIFVNGVSNERVALSNNKTIAYTVELLGAGTSDTAMFELKGVAKNVSGTLTDVGNLYELIIVRTNAAISVDARVVTGSAGLGLFVSGLSGTTISWRAVVSVMEI